jgi:hypothetical protein
MKRITAICVAAMLLMAAPVIAQYRLEGQPWDKDYTAREWLQDCHAQIDRCRFFIRTVAQASYWYDKCIPYMTSLTEVEGVMLTFLEQHRQYVDDPATNILLTAITMKWCKTR